jgi:prolyl 4-hydroxylase
MMKLYATLFVALACLTSQSVAALTSMRHAPFSGARRIETLSWSPRAFLYHNFLSDEEADHIIATARPSMHRSTVLGVDGKDETNEVRTSYGTFLSRFQDQILTNVQKRVELWTQLNVSHQEDMQVLRYGVGQKYSPHYDSIVEESPRMATVLIYLTDVEQGGETSFPKVRIYFLVHEFFTKVCFHNTRVTMQRAE